MKRPWTYTANVPISNFWQQLRSGQASDTFVVYYMTSKHYSKCTINLIALAVKVQSQFFPTKSLEVLLCSNFKIIKNLSCLPTSLGQWSTMYSLDMETYFIVGHSALNVKEPQCWGKELLRLVIWMTIASQEKPCTETLSTCVPLQRISSDRQSGSLRLSGKKTQMLPRQFHNTWRSSKICFQLEL